MKRSRRAPILESSIQATIKAWLDLQTWCTAWRVHLGPVLQHRGGKPVWTKNPMTGFPDLGGVLQDGRMFAIECKSATGALSDKQREWGDKLRAFNVLWVEARSLDDVINFFQRELGAG